MPTKKDKRSGVYMTLYAAKDDSQRTYLYTAEPSKRGGCWVTSQGGLSFEVSKDLFPELDTFTCMKIKIHKEN